MALSKKRKPKTVSAVGCGGSTQLEVKGEASYQTNLERVAGPKTADGPTGRSSLFITGRQRGFRSARG